MLTLPITTERLLLRVPEPADLGPLHALYTDPVALEHIGTQAAWNRERTGRLLERWIADHREHGYGLAAAVLRDGGGLAGLVGLSPDENGDPELSCMLARAFWRGGYGGEALAACLALAQRDPRFPVIRARMETAHPAIAHVERQVLFRHGFAATGEEPFPHSGRLMRHYRWTAPTDTASRR